MFVLNIRIYVNPYCYDVGMTREWCVLTYESCIYINNEAINTHHVCTIHNTPQHNIPRHITTLHDTSRHTTSYYNTSQYTTRLLNTPQHTTTYHDTPQHIIAHNNTPQHTTTHHNTSQHTTTHHGTSGDSFIYISKHLPIGYGKLHDIQQGIRILPRNCRQCVVDIPANCLHRGSISLLTH